MALFRAPALDDPRTSPTDEVEIDWSHPLANALAGVWLFNQWIDSVRNLVNGRLVTAPNYDPMAYPAFASISGGPGGNAWKVNTTNNDGFVLGPANEVYGPNSTFGLVVRDYAASGSGYTTMSDGTFDAFVPYSDGGVYFDYPSSSNRVSFSAGTTSAMCAYTLSGGSAGRTITRNGAVLYSDTTTTAQASPTTSSFFMGSSGAPTFEYYSMFSWKRQLTVAEQVSWALAPYAMLRPVGRRQFFGVAAAGTGGTTPPTTSGVPFSQAKAGGTVPTAYVKSPVPTDAASYAVYLENELTKIQTTLQTVSALTPQAATKAPPKPIENMMRFAKAPWRPVSGQTTDRWVTYANGAWVYTNGL